MPTTRRAFLARTAALSAGAVVPYHLTASRARAQSTSPNERLRFALIGCGGNGTRTAPVGQRFADLVALCDVDTEHSAFANETLCNGKADLYADYREVIARDDIDVVQISTPDHWHAKILVEAMLAGKDAYCEKPLTLTIDEGKLVRRIQRETGAVVQVGTQQRSSFDKFNKALALLADGRVGQLKKMTVGIDRGSWSPELPEAPVPESLDWDRWLGPTPVMPYRHKQRPDSDWHYTNGHIQFRWWYEHSGGKLTDWGAHHLDIAMLGLAATGQNNDPVSVEGTAEHAVEFRDGVPVQTDRYNTAQKFDLTVRFASSDVEMNVTSEADNGILFEGEEGRFFVNRGKLVGKAVEQLKDKPLPSNAISEVYRGLPMAGNDRHAHWNSFVHAIDKRILPISDVHSHMKMLNVCHLAGICCRLGLKINWDQATEQITGDDLAASMMQRPYRDGYAIDLG